jgi:hypothetical protein
VIDRTVMGSDETLFSNLRWLYPVNYYTNRIKFCNQKLHNNSIKIITELDLIIFYKLGLVALKIAKI